MNIKRPFKGVDKTLHVILFVGLYMLAQCGAQPLRKRSVSEVQLMHNVWEHKHTRARQDWLQMKLGNIHSSGPTSGARRGPLPLDLPDSKDLTPEQITLAMNVLEKVLSSRHSQ